MDRLRSRGGSGFVPYSFYDDATIQSAPDRGQHRHQLRLFTDPDHWLLDRQALSAPGFYRGGGARRHPLSLCADRCTSRRRERENVERCVSARTARRRNAARRLWADQFGSARPLCAQRHLSAGPRRVGTDAGLASRKSMIVSNGADHALVFFVFARFFEKTGVSFSRSCSRFGTAEAPQIATSQHFSFASDYPKCVDFWIRRITPPRDRRGHRSVRRPPRRKSSGSLWRCPYIRA